jgi:glycosyltransferase involved in cell wall biosynthesis
MQCTNLGGMEQAAYRVMGELVKTGMTFRIASPRPFGPGRDRVLEFDPAARDFAYRGRFGWRDFIPFRRHVHAMARDCDAVWVTGTSAAALAAIGGLKAPKLLSHHYHHFETLLSGLKWRLFYALLCRDLAAVTYPAEFTRREALTVAPWLAARAHVVHNGVDVAYDGADWHRRARAAARRALGIADDAFVIGNAGWLIARKRFDVFLETARAVRALLPGALFQICGDGPLRGELMAQADALGLADAVRFEGWQGDLAPYYRAWDVLLFNSDFDAFGLSPLEAAAQGCLVVASVRYGGLGEFLTDGENGFLLADHDTAELAARIARLAADGDLRARLRDSAAARVRADYSLGAATAFYADFFSRAAGARP